MLLTTSVLGVLNVEVKTRVRFKRRNFQKKFRKRRLRRDKANKFRKAFSGHSQSFSGHFNTNQKMFCGGGQHGCPVFIYCQASNRWGHCGTDRHVATLLVFVNIHRSGQITQHFIRPQVHIPAQEKQLLEFFQRTTSSGDVSFRQRTNGSEHLGAVYVMMMFSCLHGDFGIRNVCCFSFGEYCLSESSTLLKSYNMFLHLNTRALFWQTCKPGFYFLRVVSLRH